MRTIILAASLLLMACANDAPAYEPVIRDDVTVTRDEWGVPTISGETDAAVAYGIATAHAEDDFATIQRRFLAVKRRLGRLDGREGAEADFLSYVLRTEEVARAGWTTQLTATDREVLDAYADGLNAYAAAHPGEVLDRAAFPVTGKDVAGGFVLTAPLFFFLDAVVGPLVEGEALPLTPSDLTRGSNAFAVSARRSDDGHTRLISNSHQPWSGPVAWYELAVKSAEGWRFRGVTFPGVPFPLMGHNEHLGYTNTVNRPDLIDVYELTTDGDRYLFGGEWRALERREVTLRVKVGPLTVPAKRTLWRSVHGPVFRSDRGDFALRYAGMGDFRSVGAYRRLARSRDWEEFSAVLAEQAIHSTNFVYADASGTIAYVYNASIPERTPGYDYWGVLPGDDPKALWSKTVPWDRIPKLVNPPSGWVMNANNAPFSATDPADDLDPAAFPAEMGIEPYATNRAMRAVRLLTAIDGPISEADLLRVKFDRAYEEDSPPGLLMRGVMAVRSDDPLVREAAALLHAWDWTANGEGPADTLAALVMKTNRPAAYGSQPAPDAEETLRDAAAYLMRHHGRLDVPLPEALRLRRGDTDLPLTGGYDALRAIGWENAPDGVMEADFGDGFVMIAEWDEDGRVASRTVQPFGAAVGRPASPHHTDQSVLFAGERFKPTGF